MHRRRGERAIPELSPGDSNVSTTLHPPGTAIISTDCGGCNVEGVQLLERSGQLPPTPSTPPGGRPRTAQQHPLVRTSLTPRSPLAGGWCESPLAQRCCRAFSSSWRLRSSTAGPATNAVEIGGPPSTAQAGARAKMGAAWRACTSTASVAASRSTALRRQNAAASQTSTPAMRSRSCCRLTLEAGLAARPTSTCATFVDA